MRTSWAARLAPIALAVVAVASSASIAACAPDRYVYSPAGRATALVSGRPAALYGVPLQAPHGDVRIAAFGIATLEPERDDADRIESMHVRMVVANRDDVGPWQVDTRRQIGGLDGAGRSRPAFASSSVGRPPTISIPRGSAATLDLYYPLPEDLQTADEIPQFDVSWEVLTPAGPVAERTPFVRLTVETPPPPPDYYTWGLGWGWGPGWYDPLWPDYTFVGPPSIVLRVGPRPFIQVPPRPMPPRPAPPLPRPAPPTRRPFPPRVR